MTCPLCGSENIYIVLETGEVDCEDCEYHYPPLDKSTSNS